MTDAPQNAPVAKPGILDIAPYVGVNATMMYMYIGININIKI